VDVNAKDEAGCTALHYAALSGFSIEILMMISGISIDMYINMISGISIEI
jgi:ankyrin repeat protein